MKRFLYINTHWQPVWQDLAKFRHFGTVLKTLAILKEFVNYLETFWAYFGKFYVLLGNFSVL